MLMIFATSYSITVEELELREDNRYYLNGQLFSGVAEQKEEDKHGEGVYKSGVKVGGKLYYNEGGQLYMSTTFDMEKDRIETERSLKDGSRSKVVITPNSIEDIGYYKNNKLKYEEKIKNIDLDLVEVANRGGSALEEAIKNGENSVVEYRKVDVEGNLIYYNKVENATGTEIVIEDEEKVVRKGDEKITYYKSGGKKYVESYIGNTLSTRDIYDEEGKVEKKLYYVDGCENVEYEAPEIENYGSPDKALMYLKEIEKKDEGIKYEREKEGVELVFITDNPLRNSKNGVQIFLENVKGYGEKKKLLYKKEVREESDKVIISCEKYWENGKKKYILTEEIAKEDVERIKKIYERAEIFNGRIPEESIKIDIKSELIAYDESGKIIFSGGADKNSWIERYYNDGKLQTELGEIRDKEVIKDIKREYFTNEKLKYERVALYDDISFFGKEYSYKTFYLNGNPKSERVYKGESERVEKEYYNNGKLRSEKNSIEKSIPKIERYSKKFYYLNGVTEMEFYYGRTPNLKEQYNYESDGTPISTYKTYFDDDGNIIKEEEF